MMPYPLQGHITPLMQLSKLLAARGFVITFVTSEFNVKRLLQANQEQKIGELVGLDIRLVGIPDGLPDNHDRNPLSLDFVMSLDTLHSSFEELVERMQVVGEGPPITCIVSDSFLVRTQEVANKWDIPRVSFWPNSMAAFACSLNVQKIMEATSNLDPFKAHVYQDPESGSTLLRCIPGIPEIRTCEMPFYTLGGHDSEEWMRSHVEKQMACLDQNLCIIANSFPDLESGVCQQLLEAQVPCKVFTLGPLLPSAFLGSVNGLADGGTGASMCDEEECMEWLDTQRAGSVLYISLGSIATLEPDEIQEIGLGLAASNQPFLWVLRPSAAHDPRKPVSVLLPEELQKKIALKHGKIIRWAPQLRVLSHKAVGGFLTHCGWNSTLESVSMGVPVIGWPQMMDQITNCWFMVEQLKVGVRLDKKAERAGVERAIRRLMQEPEGHHMRARASKLNAAARSAFTRALPSNLQSLVDTILSTRP